jgi:hypothetical protein
MTICAGVLKSPFLKFASTELAWTVHTPRSNDAPAFADAGAGRPGVPGRDDGRPAGIAEALALAETRAAGDALGKGAAVATAVAAVATAAKIAIGRIMCAALEL